MGSLRRWRFFPGWTMLGISAAAQFMSAPGQSYSVAAFKEPMRQSLGVSETSYSLAYGVATLISGLSLPLTGRLLDRFGARRMLPVVATLLAMGCIVMSHVTRLPSLYLGFTLVRCLGQGALTLIATWLVGEWFLRRRGFATALSGLGSSLSVVAFPLVNSWLLQHYGWQTAWWVLGVTVFVSLVPVSLWLLRDRPEDIGLHPDGVQPVGSPEPNASAGIVPTADVDDSWTLDEVLRDATFWKLLSVPVCTGMIGTGMIFHQVTLLGERGISSSSALALISFQATVATLAALGAGWLADLWRTERLLAVAMLLLSGSVAIVWQMPHPLFAIGYAISMGLHGSILRSAGTVVWVNYYGRRHQGAVRGTAMSAMILAAALGPLPLALSRDRLGSYDAALMTFTLLPLLAAVCVLTASVPVRRATDQKDR